MINTCHGILRHNLRLSLTSAMKLSRHVKGAAICQSQPGALADKEEIPMESPHACCLRQLLINVADGQLFTCLRIGFRVILIMLGIIQLRLAMMALLLSAVNFQFCSGHPA